jgi:hypothetical protein
MSIGYLFFAVNAWHLTDAGAYWNAAMRLRSGQDLYPIISNVEASDVYRYSPWFAWLAIPFTYLPLPVAGVIWSLVLIASSTVAIIPLARRKAWLGVAFFWPMLIGISAIGNVHPLMIAALVIGVERRSGPLWIAMAASLKAFPILLVMVYVGRRQWRRTAACLALSAVFLSPFLLYRLDHYPTGAGEAALLIAWPPAYVSLVGLALVITLRLGRTKWSWLAASATVCLSLPRFFVYDTTYLLVGANSERKVR